MKYILYGLKLVTCWIFYLSLYAHLCFNTDSTAEVALTTSANTGESETFQDVAMYWIQIEEKAMNSIWCHTLNVILSTIQQCRDTQFNIKLRW